MSAATSARPAVSVDELKRAWAAVQAGQFRQTGAGGSALLKAARPTGPAAAEWVPEAGERTIAVLGCAGSVGASTVALALGLAAPEPVRVVECCSAPASGMAAASGAELGLHPGGWRQGKRQHLLLERVSDALTHVDDVPPPILATQANQLTILDVGWDAGLLLDAGCWLTDATRAADAVVVVTTATVPGMRRLEPTLALLGVDRPVVVVVGPRRKKWPRGVEHSAGPAARRAFADARCVEIPHDRVLAVAGLDSRPMAAPVGAAATQLLDRLLHPSSGR